MQIVCRQCSAVCKRLQPACRINFSIVPDFKSNSKKPKGVKRLSKKIYFAQSMSLQSLSIMKAAFTPVIIVANNKATLDEPVAFLGAQKRLAQESLIDQLRFLGHGCRHIFTTIQVADSCVRS